MSEFYELKENEIEWLPQNELKMLYMKVINTLEKEKVNLITFNDLVNEQKKKSTSNFASFRMHFQKALPFFLEAIKEDHKCFVLASQAQENQIKYYEKVQQMFNKIQSLNEANKNYQLEYPQYLCDFNTQIESKKEVSSQDILKIELSIWK